MPDWPAAGTLVTGIINSGTSFASLTGEHNFFAKAAATGSAVWPAANRAIYMPFIVDQTVTAYQMAFSVATQSGNCDVGIYNEPGNRLVSSGSTAVAAAGIQTIDITDTTLTPGLYFMAMNVDNTTAAFTRGSGLAAVWLQVCGVQQQAVGAVTLPDPATFANPASAYLPFLVIALKATI